MAVSISQGRYLNVYDVNISPASHECFAVAAFVLHYVSNGDWSGREDLNLRLPAPKAGALPGCATPRRLNKSLSVGRVKIGFAN